MMKMDQMQLEFSFGESYKAESGPVCSFPQSTPVSTLKVMAEVVDLRTVLSIRRASEDAELYRRILASVRRFA